MVENRCSVQREGVYHWFSILNSAQRAEFLCGLLDLCVPIELRFLGSCLEDLARKDYHSLRDAEIKANNPADLSNLTNITDDVVRSKLLISLALLNSDNRDAAGVLFRTLTHIDSVINNYGLQLNDGRTGEQFLLLFTMASNHPAFSFHQKQVLRQELTQIQEILQVTCGEQQAGTGGCSGTGALATLSPATSIPTYITAPTLNSSQAGCPCCHKTSHREDGAGRVDEGIGPEPMPHMTSLSCKELPVKVHVGKPGKVNIERIELSGVTHKGEKPSEYMLEVTWSDSSVSTVSRTHQEVLNFLSQVSQLFPDEGLEKFLLQSLGLDQAPELDPRCLTVLPAHILKHYQAELFFSTATTALSSPPTASLGCLFQYRGANRALCGVASIQTVMSVHNSIQTRSPTQLPPQGTVPILPPGGVGVAGGDNALPPGHLQNPGPPLQSIPEQNGILDWLRKLRLHKYYPVFKQLTMEEFLGLTEEDLNKYDLTQGAKKKLKTQLELQNREKMEKRYMMSQFPVSCSGIARVTPSSHIGPVAHVYSSSNTELCVEVETGVHPLTRDSSSSSGYSSAPSSPMTPHSLSLSREGAFDRAKEPHRRMESGLELGEKDRTYVLLNPTATTGPSRPTAQVLPVQNDPTPCPSHMSLPPPSLSLHSPGRILGPPCKPRLPLFCPDERAKPLGSGVAVGVRLERVFPGLGVDSMGSPPLRQDSAGPRGPSGVTVLRPPPVLMVDTSSALTTTSNTLHHVSHPPLHLQVSPSLRHTGHYPYSSASSSSSSSSPASKLAFPSVGGVHMGTASSVPMAAVPGNTYCVNSSAAVQPSSSPTSTETSSYAVTSGSTPNSSVCVCSSCGCSGNCGSYGALPASYAGYFHNPFSGTSVFPLGPLLHLSPLLAGSSTATPFPYPLVAPPLYNSSMSHSHDTQGQQGLILPPMQGFLGAGANVHKPHGGVGNGGHRKPGSLSCYNCGVTGHRAQECKQPPMDAAQQGTFRLKYAPKSDSQDSGD
ncbi:zinc finger CCHC domain-containing protein 14-like isoform X1 [Salmo trutta]|uniref:zinc finger CCHC domain-containing protein 14-like isoform X1 n=1 Tax=Salmo trutta TaxID=8032 RepID=UPI0011329854|nr:zinc finger CCHC domain-containing protein 14-like isoform X1 [Salmo trutta]